MREKDQFERLGRNAVIADLESYNWTVVNKSKKPLHNVLMAIKGSERLVVLISTIVENLLPDENFESYRSFLQAKSYKNGTIMYEAKVLLDKKLRMKKIEFVEVGV